MKIAVYAIAKNESKFVERFMASCKGADGVYVLDTGSIDDTINRLDNFGANIGRLVTDNFRFDIARNTSLSRVPADVDVCVCLDLDEVLPDGWRQQIEKAWKPETTRLRYPFIWQHDPEIMYYADKIHARHGCKWVKPVHETLEFDRPESVELAGDLIVEHFPDQHKSRANYLPLLQLAVQENQACDRSSHYLGRELMFRGFFQDAVHELARHLSLPSAKWDVERCASMRFISQCQRALGHGDSARRWASEAVVQCPYTREPWMQVVRIAYDMQDWAVVKSAALQLLSIGPRAKGIHYITDPDAWGWMPYDYLANACYHLGDKQSARNAWLNALDRKPPQDDRDRVLHNLSFCQPPVA